MTNINKDQFVAILNDIAEIEEMCEEIEWIFDKYNCRDFRSGYAYYDHKMIDHMINILDACTNEDNWVNYWVNELECGKKWNPDTVVDPQGNSIDISTPEKLYDFLFSPNVF